jgi:hypothetical protein
MKNGKDRRTMTMCMQLCYYDYEQKRYELLGSGKPTGVIAILTRTRVEDLVMSTLRKCMQQIVMKTMMTRIIKMVICSMMLSLTYDQSPVVHASPSVQRVPV